MIFEALWKWKRSARETEKEKRVSGPRPEPCRILTLERGEEASKGQLEWTPLPTE